MWWDIICFDGAGDKDSMQEDIIRFDTARLDILEALKLSGLAEDSVERAGWGMGD